MLLFGYSYILLGFWDLQYVFKSIYERGVVTHGGHSL